MQQRLPGLIYAVQHPYSHTMPIEEEAAADSTAFSISLSTLLLKINRLLVHDKFFVERKEKRKQLLLQKSC